MVSLHTMCWTRKQNQKEMIHHECNRQAAWNHAATAMHFESVLRASALMMHLPDERSVTLPTSGRWTAVRSNAWRRWSVRDRRAESWRWGTDSAATESRETGHKRDGRRARTRVGTVNIWTDSDTAQTPCSWSSTMNAFINCGYIWNQQPLRCYAMGLWSPSESSDVSKATDARFLMLFFWFSWTRIGQSFILFDRPYWGRLSWNKYINRCNLTVILLTKSTD